MEETFAEFLKLNESKNIMAVAGTPLTLAALWVMLDPQCPAWPHKKYNYRFCIQIQTWLKIQIQLQITDTITDKRYNYR